MFRPVLGCKRCLIHAYFSPDPEQMAFSLEEATLWTHILARSNSLKLNRLNYGFVTNSFCLLQMLTDGLERCELLWCFISCLDSHSDGTHSLQSIHLWASDGYVSLNVLPWRNKRICIFNSQLNFRSFHFGMNYSFKHKMHLCTSTLIYLQLYDVINNLQDALKSLLAANKMIALFYCLYSY